MDTIRIFRRKHEEAISALAELDSMELPEVVKFATALDIETGQTDYWEDCELELEVYGRTEESASARIRRRLNAALPGPISRYTTAGAFSRLADLYGKNWYVRFFNAYGNVLVAKLMGEIDDYTTHFPTDQKGAAITAVWAIGFCPDIDGALDSDALREYPQDGCLLARLVAFARKNGTVEGFPTTDKPGEYMPALLDYIAETHPEEALAMERALDAVYGAERK